MRGKERRTDYLRCSLVFKFPLLSVFFSIVATAREGGMEGRREGGRELL